ncbi:MAG: SH3 domain-containing protein [Desulfobacterales bacterium]
MNGNMMSVRVKTGQLRSAPSFLGKIVQNLPYGTQVRGIGENQGWYHVSAPDGSRGWMHSSALTEKHIVLKPGADNVGQYASGEELALAGKGFSKQVEDEFRARNPHMDFSWIDRMETYRVSQREMEQFLRQGELHPEGGV